MRQKLFPVVATCLVIGSGVSAASPITDGMVVVEPTGMTDRAQTSTMPWCAGTPFPSEGWDEGRIRRSLGSPRDRDLWAEALSRACTYKADPTWVKQATYIVQNWMNFDGSSQADAEAAIAARIAKIQAERANAGKPQSDEDRFAFGPTRLTVTKPVDGADQASITGTIPWCDVAKISERWDQGRIMRTVQSDDLVAGALQMCQRPNDATWKVEAGYILQKWMNSTKQSQPDAVKSLRARIQDSKWSSDRDALCKSLEFSPEIAGSAKLYAQARRQLFACDDAKPLWISRNGAYLKDVVFYLDGEGTVDPLLTMYALYSLTSTPFKMSHQALPNDKADYNAPLLYHAIAQYDYARLDASALAKQLSQAPYDNDYARTIINESLALLQTEHAAYEAATDKLVKDDADYKAVLRDAAPQGVQQWEKTAASWKAELDRSAAFEKLLSQPSRKVLAGCAAPLQKDAEKLIKSYRLHDYEAIIDKLAGDPIASLLLSRLAVCDAVDGVPGQAGALRQIIEKGRDLRGPRSAAYYAVLDALVAARKDRPQFRLSTSGFWLSGTSLVGLYPGFNYSGGAIHDWGGDNNRGVIKSLKKVGDGVLLEFKTVKITSENVACKDTNRVVKIDVSGHLVYAQQCHGVGTFTTQDVTNLPIVLPASAAGGLASGQYVVFVETSVKAKGGQDFGIVAFSSAKAGDKKILSFYGFDL